MKTSFEKATGRLFGAVVMLTFPKIREWVELQPKVTFASQHRSKLLCVVSLVVLMIGAVASCAFLRYPYIDRELSGPVALKQEWLELTPKEPLRVERDTQEITLFPDPPIQMVDGPNGGLVPGDGRSANIEVELMDSNGKIHHSSPGISESMTGNLKVTSRSLNFENLPRDVTYKTVRIRSSNIYPVKKILWRCYNWSSVHK